MKTTPLILLDAGHGVNTPGKQSPDGRLREYAYARRLVNELQGQLRATGIPTFLVTPEKTDVSLALRVQRANAAYVAHGRCGFLVSVHCNAAGCGQWMQAHGWSVHVDPAASARSKAVAGCFFDAARVHGLTVRQQVPGQKYVVQPLYLCGRRAAYPAVLTENLFQDNRQDVDFLLSPQGFRTLVDVHLQAMKSALALWQA